MRWKQAHASTSVLKCFGGHSSVTFAYVNPDEAVCRVPQCSLPEAAMMRVMRVIQAGYDTRVSRVSRTFPRTTTPQHATISPRIHATTGYAGIHRTDQRFGIRVYDGLRTGILRRIFHHLEERSVERRTVSAVVLQAVVSIMASRTTADEWIGGSLPGT